MKPIRSLISLALLSAALFSAGCGGGHSPGVSEKIGTLVRVSKIGLFSQTWEAQIVRGGFQNGSGAMGAAFDFTIEDPALVQMCRAYMDEGREVKITYRTEFVYALTRSETGGHFLISIEPVAKAK